MQAKVKSKAKKTSKAKAVSQSMTAEAMTTKEKRQYKKAIEGIEKADGAFLILMNLGHSFLWTEDMRVTGYSLAYAVKMADKEIESLLESVELPDTEAGKKADRRLLDAAEIISDMARIVEELSYDSDDWKPKGSLGGFGMAVGNMILTMTLAAAREAEYAVIDLGGDGQWGFTSPDYLTHNYR